MDLVNRARFIGRTYRFSPVNGTIYEFPMFGHPTEYINNGEFIREVSLTLTKEWYPIFSVNNRYIGYYDGNTIRRRR